MNSRNTDVGYSVQDEANMPKKPFTPLEVQNQRERIMDCASQVISDFGYHHLSMRNLAKQLNMTASNIYNYFSSKEILYLNTRRRGFELLFSYIKNTESKLDKNRGTLFDLSVKVINYGLNHPGYYQLIFRGPKLSFSLDQLKDITLISDIDMFSKEWQSHVEKLIVDNIDQYPKLPKNKRSELFLSYMSSVLGMIDNFQYPALPAIKDCPNDTRDEMIYHLIDQIIVSLKVNTHLQLYSDIVDVHKVIDFIKCKVDGVI